jgi:threonine dehydrogenase-like Zn-dependent dehydrogenase
MLFAALRRLSICLARRPCFIGQACFGTQGLSAEFFMRAITYQGIKDVRLDMVDDPEIHAADDIVLRVTATAIGGSDLHVYRGRIAGMNYGDILGREFMGIVEETGSDVTRVARGDRVVVPFVIACGHCRYCSMNLFAACQATNIARNTHLDNKQVHPGAALFGYGDLYGAIPGGQAEYVRVPRANVGPLKVPESLTDDRVLFLSDILPTAYQAVLNAGVGERSTLAIFGAGAVGLMAAACARMLGVQTLYLVDESEPRLQFAVDNYGAIPVHFGTGAVAAEKIIAHTAQYGVDAAIDAVGLEAKGSPAETMLTALKMEGSSAQALRQAIAAIRRGGILSVAGFYAGQIHGFPFGDIFDKGITVRGGQTHVQRYLPELLRFVEDGKLNPQAIVSHRLMLSQAAQAYHMLDQQHDGCRKVILTP